MSAQTVFISYRRDSGEYAAQALYEALTSRGYDVFVDVNKLVAGVWQSQILAEVPKRAHFIVLLTDGALERCADPEDFFRREFEAALASGRNIVPVRATSTDRATLEGTCPESMRVLFTLQMADLGAATLRADVGTLVDRFIAPHMAPTDAAPARPAFHADVSRIGEYSPAELIGRDSELALLTEAWQRARDGSTPRQHVITFVALGGEGKTSLVAKWLAQLAADDWPGCEAAFAWSFYRQGSSEHMATSADLFLKAALSFFGESEMAASPRSAFEKGRRLAELVGERRAILVLDGLEPLQYAPMSPQRGRLKDHGLSELLKGLAAANRGLCIVTTRDAVADLKSYSRTTALDIELPRLSPEAGVSLLTKLGVHGPAKKLADLVEDVKGHALTLTVFGAFLRDAHGGAIERRDRVRLDEADQAEQGGHAFRVMDAYSSWLESDAAGRHALTILSLLSLFDRPASAESFAALRRAPEIPYLTTDLSTLTDEQVNLVLSRLQAARLLTVERTKHGELVALDTHPLLRQYFEKRIRAEHEESWREGHRMLFEHLCQSTRDRKKSPTLEDLEPIYEAVAHGCKASLHPAACEVYRTRIVRWTDPADSYYSTKHLGAVDADLSAIGQFFDKLWSEVSTNLVEATRGWILNEAATRLTASGRLVEAKEPSVAALEIQVRLRAFDDAADVAINLSDIERALGEVTSAIATANSAILYAKQFRARKANQNSIGLVVVSRSALAEALLHRGDFPEAEASFNEAETIQMREDRRKFLYSLQGFFLCELLLRKAERVAWRESHARRERFGSAGRAGGGLTQDAAALDCRTVVQRAEWILARTEEYKRPLLDLGLAHLTVAHCNLYAAILKPSLTKQMARARQESDTAVDELRRSGRQDYLPLGLLTRAWQRFVSGIATGRNSAQSDLDEAWEIAERGPMPLYLADIHLYRARLFHAHSPYPWSIDENGNARGPLDDLREARRLIEKHEYWRRKEELEDAEAAARGW